MLSIVCVYQPGGGFYDEYVYRLRDAVAEHCHAPHRFVCLTNEKLPGIERLPLICHWPGYWNKLELFKYRPWFFDGPLLYLDLDVIVCGDITAIATYPHRFSALSQLAFNRPSRVMLSSSVMAWQPSAELSARLYDAFDSRLIARYDWPKNRRAGQRPSSAGDPLGYGDEAWLNERVTEWDCLLGLFPGRFQVRGRAPALGPETSIYICAGQPRPHRFGWRLPPRAACA